MKTFEDIVEFHGHVCPGLALGYRVSMFALKELGERALDEELVAIVENNSCAVDAVQVITGCTFGKGNLIFKDYGKQVYTFIKGLFGIASQRKVMEYGFLLIGNLRKKLMKKKTCGIDI
jgi:formylmethanofuran dehydrogenase subunit E